MDDLFRYSKCSLSRDVFPPGGVMLPLKKGTMRLLRKWASWRCVLWIALFEVTMMGAGCTSMKPVNANEIITVGTYNVRCPGDKEPERNWERRIPLICEVMRRTGVEIVGLQEPVDAQLQGLLAGTDFKHIGVARNDFKKGGEYSCILYDSKRFDVLESGTFGLSEQPDVPGVKSWGSACPRIASWGLFCDRRTGKKFLFYNTHLDHKSEPARRNGIKLIVEQARNSQYAEVPMILTGDFNSSPNSETFQMASSLLKDSQNISETPHKGTEGTFHKWGTLPHRRIDYIFVSSEIRVLQHWTEDGRVNGVHSSDHDPVFAKIVL